MINIEEEFEKLKEKVQKQEEKYENFQMTSDNLKLPHIFLTSKEINEFNQECEKSRLNLKVVPLFDYMNLLMAKEEDRSIDSDFSLIEKSYISKIKDDEQEEEKHNNKRIILSKSNKGKNVNNYLNKKKERDFKENEKEEEIKINENCDDNDDSFFSFKSNLQVNKVESLNKNKAKKKQLIKRNHLNKKTQKIKHAKNNDVNINFNNYFKKIKETGEQLKNIDKRKEELISEISENSQNLTKEGLKEIADNKHIRLVGDQFKINDLNQKTVNQLEILLGDIQINSNVNKLEIDRKDDIKTIKNKEEMERKSHERALKKKMKKEEKKRSKSFMNENNNKSNNSKNDDESESESSYEQNDSLE